MLNYRCQSSLHWHCTMHKKKKLEAALTVLSVNSQIQIKCSYIALLLNLIFFFIYKISLISKMDLSIREITSIYLLTIDGIFNTVLSKGLPRMLPVIFTKMFFNILVVGWKRNIQYGLLTVNYKSNFPFIRKNINIRINYSGCEFFRKRKEKKVE